MEKKDLLELLQMSEEVFDFLKDKKVTQITHGIPEISGFTTRQVTRRELNPRTGRMVNVTRSEIVPKFGMRYAYTPAQLSLLQLAQGWQKEGWEWFKQLNISNISYTLSNNEQSFNIFDNRVIHNTPKTLFTFSYDRVINGLRKTETIELTDLELANKLHISLDQFKTIEGATYNLQIDPSVKTEHLVVLDDEIGLFVNGELTPKTHDIEEVYWANLQFYNGNSSMKEDIPQEAFGNLDNVKVIQYILDRPDSRIDPPMCWVEVASGKCYLEFPGHLER